ncbi:MAG: CBS domain-containing protein, partial [Verrucomicrobiales bacterium]|nr:CBS domain-containing protein [Verrucomicrobiales bacterium]
EGDHGHSDEELRLMIQGAPREGHDSTLGRDVVLNALELRRRQAREVMQPRPEVVVFAMEDSIEDCVRLAEETRYSRFPLCEGGDIDRAVGVVHIKDLYSRRDRKGKAADLRGFARPLIYVPEFARLERVMQFLLERRLHLALVVDEYGGTVGLLTLENILEELVGQIQDEFDQEKPLLVPLDENNWEVAGNLPLHDLGHLVKEQLRSPGVSSASGWVTQRLGGFPREGDTVPVGGYVVRVEETRGARVVRLRVTRVGATAGAVSGAGVGDGPSGEDPVTTS